MTAVVERDDEVPIFAGGVGESVSSFMKEYESYCEEKKWDEKEKVTKLRRSLRGSMTRWYDRLGKDEKKGDWKNLREKFLMEFGDKKREKIGLRKEMTERTQTCDESVEQYYQSLVWLASKIPRIEEDEIRSVFIYGLESTIRRYVEDFDPESLAEAKKLAKRKERLLRRLREEEKKNEEKKDPSRSPKRKLREEQQEEEDNENEEDKHEGQLKRELEYPRRR